ncbi:MAG: serine/threonine protein kinase [Myxococcales bacterium]|nr:serine/threonine protein kinase [Myxococcales bacterium]
MLESPTIATTAYPSRVGADEDDIRTQTSSSKLRIEDLRTTLPRALTKPPPTTPPPSSATTGSGSTTVGSPLEALERDEILRTRRFCFVGIAIALFGAASVPLLPGDPTATTLLLSAVGVAIVAMLFLLMRTYDPLEFRKPSTSLGWFVPAACVTTAIPYFGCFSPAPLILVLGIYFTGLGKSSRLAFAVYATCAGMQAFVAGLVIAGVRDTGLVRAPDLTRRDQLVLQIVVQIVLAATLLTARMSRRTALVAVGELERAVRVAAHREALLLEAREELERALRSGRGRFSDQTIGGYRLGAVLGRGAMGEVYEAAPADAAQGPVAIKLLSQTSLGNATHVLRFLRELRTAAALESPNVVRVIEVGEQPVPYLVMERLEGMTLGDLLRGRKALSGDEVIDLVAQIGNGITAAAQAGIVHRDLKPQNVFLHHGTWKILDFGVARGMEQGDTLTAGHVVGTPSYMAPEQASGGSVDHLTDLYALAAIAYRALTGYPPYAAGEIAETLYRVVHTAPRRPTDLAPQLPADVDLVLAIALAKQATDRFASAADLASALAAALAGKLPYSLRAHAETLVRAGAWTSAPTRPTTSRLRLR